MIKLYGAPVSNFYNAVKLTLLEKGFEFEEIRTYPSQKKDYLEKSPMGKIPIIEVREGFLSETSTILDFLEEINPEIPLFPSDPFERAKVRELMSVFELYVDAPLRRLLPSIIQGQEVGESLCESVRTDLARGMSAANRLVSINPHLTGGDYTFLDIYAYYVLSLTRRVTIKIYQWDLLNEVEGLTGWFQMMSEKPMVQSIDRIADDEMKKFFAD